MTDMREALRDSLLTFWAAGASAARQNKEATHRAFDDEAKRLTALMQPEIDRRVVEEKAKLLVRLRVPSKAMIVEGLRRADIDGEVYHIEDFQLFVTGFIDAAFEKDNIHEQG